MLGNKTKFLAIILFFIVSLYFINGILADPIGEVDTIGTTWCEEQWGCENSGPQIAIDSTIGAVYIVWSYAPAWSYWGSYSGFNCYFPDSGWVYGDTGMEILPGQHKYHSIMLHGNGGGRENIEITAFSRPFNQMTQRAWWNRDHFESMPLDTVNAPEEESPFPTLSRNGTVQLLALGTGMWDFGSLVYGRYTLDPYNFEGWQYIDTISSGTYCIATSPVSSKVAISYIRQKTFCWDDTMNLSLNKNVFYIFSSDGETWDFPSSHNITQFSDSDAFRACDDNDLIFDYGDIPHIVFRAFEAKINEAEPESSKATGRMTFIWHWSEDSDSFTVAADGWIRDTSNFYGFGGCRTSVCKPQLAINPANNYLYILYERNYNDDRSSIYGYPNSDLWISASTDNGLNWSSGINITDTHTPMCFSGQCASEIQASLYNVVDDTIHVVYILDKDAGFAQEGEGRYTQNYVIYQKIPTELISTTPLLPQFSIRQGPPRCHYLIGDINGDGRPNGNDVVYGVIFFKGNGQIPTAICNCLDNTYPFYGAGDVNGSCSFNGLDITFYVGFLKGRQPRLLFCPSCPPDPL